MSRRPTKKNVYGKMPTPPPQKGPRAPRPPPPATPAPKPPQLQTHHPSSAPNRPTVAQDLARMGMGVLKKHHPKMHAVASKAIDHVKRRQKEADVMGDANSQGKYYTASLLFPKELPGAKVPDIKVYRTLATSSDSHYVVASVQSTGADTTFLTKFIVAPTTTSLITYGTAFAGGFITAGSYIAANDSIQTFAAANWISKRLVSMEIVVRNCTAALSMQGRWAVQRLPYASSCQIGSGGETNGTLFNTFESFAETTVGNFEPTGGKDSLRYVWFPAGPSDTNFSSTTATAVSDNTVIQFMATAVTAQTLEVDIYCNWESKVTLASEEGLAPTSTMGSSATAAESLSVAAMHPDLGSTAIKGRSTVWDVINRIAPQAMKMIPIVGEAFSWLGGAVASLFSKHPDRVLLFCQSLDDQTIDDLRDLTNLGHLPREFLYHFEALRDFHVQVSETAVKMCLRADDEKAPPKTFICRKTPHIRDEFSETLPSFRVSIGDGPVCPNCPPEFCHPPSGEMTQDTESVLSSVSLVDISPLTRARPDVVPQQRSRSVTPSVRAAVPTPNR